MPTLPEVLTDETKKSQVIKDCCELIDAEVKDKGGISGLAIKAGFGAVKGIKPGFVEGAVEDMLPEFARVLDRVGGAVGDVDAPRQARNDGRRLRADLVNPLQQRLQYI